MTIDPAVDLSEFQARALTFQLGPKGGQVAQMVSTLRACYRAYRDLDAVRVEINPLVITGAGDLVAPGAEASLVFVPPPFAADAVMEADPDPHAVMMIGELGGPQEAAAFARDRLRKPVVACIAGLSAPKGRKMGHAGAIVSAFGESAQEKVEILAAAGITVAPTPSAMGETMAMVLARRQAA